MQKVLSCFTCVEGLSLLYVKVCKGQYTSSEIQFLVVFLDSLSGNQESCPWSVPVSQNWSKQEKSVLWGARRVPQCSIPSRAVGAAGTEQDQEYNTLLESGFTWKECLFLWDRNQNIIFPLGFLGWVLSQRVWDTSALGTALYRHSSKPKTWY